MRLYHAAAVLDRVYSNANRLKICSLYSNYHNCIIIKYLTMRIILVSFLLYMFFAYSLASEVLPSHQAEL